MTPKNTIAILALLVSTAGNAQSNQTGLTASPCLNISNASDRVTLRGTLRRQAFPGSPNFESIANGDQAEDTFILELPDSICLNDGGEFADPAERVVTVHVGIGSQDVAPILAAAVGQVIEVSGEAFAAHTGHHHAPLVLLAGQVSVIARGR
jgi:hypothetical protein